MQTLEEGRINAGFLLFAGLIATTLIFGRWFCGWACHVVALQDLCAWLLVKAATAGAVAAAGAGAVGGAFQMFLWPHVEHWIDAVRNRCPRSPSGSAGGLQ